MNSVIAGSISTTSQMMWVRGTLFTYPPVILRPWKTIKGTDFSLDERQRRRIMCLDQYQRSMVLTVRFGFLSFVSELVCVLVFVKCLLKVGKEEDKRTRY